MADRFRLARAFVRAAKLRAEQLGGDNTPKSIVEAILLGQFTSAATNGRTVIRTMEAGGSTEFALPADLSPADVMALAEEALGIIEASADSTDPNVGTRRIQRLRASFAKASL